MEIPSKEKEDYFAFSKFVTELKPSDFDLVSTWKLKNRHTCSIVLFYAPWCPYCKTVKGTWEDLGKKAAFFDVYSMNCEKNISHINRIKEDAPELIGGFPTMIIYSGGNPIEKVGNDPSDRNVGYFIRSCMRTCKKS